MEKEEGDECVMGEALTLLETKWKKIAEKWIQLKEPLQKHELVELQGNLDMLQKHLSSLHAVKSLLKTLGQIRKKMVQIKLNAAVPAPAPPPIEKTNTLVLEEQIKALDLRKVEIGKQMYDMYIDEHFMSYYMASLDDYRVTSLPLPYGFVCHKVYQTELDLLKTSITETKKDLNARQELLQAHQKRYITNLANSSFSYFSNPAPLSSPLNPTAAKQLDEEEKNLITSINQGMDRHRNLQTKLYSFLNDFKPLNAHFFHFKCQALLKEKMDVMERSRELQMKLQESAQHVQE